MFKKYSSIENSYRNEFLDRIKTHNFWNKTFVVQEKAHGANLSFLTLDGISFKSCSRTNVLNREDSFYNHAQILDKNLKKFRSIWDDLKLKQPNLSQMTIYGEVIGGNYPHQDVIRSRDAKKVQKGILYSPNNEFYAFDILINADQFLSVSEVNHYFESHELLHAKTLFEGTLDDALSYSNEFESTIAANLDLPVIENNICEGVIIKPTNPLFFNNGVRVILKNKNERWSENLKFNKSIKKSEPLSEKVIKLSEAILTYVTENRLNNVLSKESNLGPKDIGRVLGLFNKDVFNDFVKDYGDIYHSLDKKEQKIITKSCTKVSAILVRKSI